MATIRPFIINDDLLVKGGDITTAGTTSTLFTTVATTLDIGEAATTISIGASTGTTTINNNLVVTGSISGTLSSSTTSTQGGYFGDIYLFDDSTPSHYLQITNSANLTAARVLSINVNDANRTVSLAGNLTLANNFTTSGNFAVTLTATASTSVTLPTTGTLATTGNLSQFASTTSAQLAGVISDETGYTTNAKLVFSTSPTFETSVVAGTASLDVFNTVATTVNAFGAATTLTIGATTGTTTIRNNLTISGDLRVDGTTTVVNSTVTSIDDPILTLGGDTSVVEVTKDRGVEFKYAGETLTISSYTGAGTTTVTGAVASTTGYAAGDIITISGATGTEQAKLNGTWIIASVPNSTTFTFVVTQTVAAGALTTTLGTTIKSKNGFFGLDQSTGRFKFIPQSLNSSEVFSGTVGDIDVNNGFFAGDIAVNGGDITTTATGATTIFNANTTNLSIGGAATTLALANTGTGARTINIATTASAGASTLTFGGAVSGNTLKVASTAAGTVNITTDVTTGIANIFASLTTGTLNLATGTGTSTINIGGAGGNVNVGAATGNSVLTVYGNGTGGTAAVATNVTTGIVNALTALTTGTLNLATGGASTTNIGGAGGLVYIGTTSGNSTLTVRGNGTTGSTTLATNVTTGSANIFTSVTGTVNIGGLASTIYLGTQAAVESSTTALSTTTQSPVDTFSATTFRSAEYLVQITQGTEYQISKILLVHDGTNVYLTEYGTITGPGSSALCTLDADIATGSVRLLVTMGTATAAVVKASRTAIVV